MRHQKSKKIYKGGHAQVRSFMQSLSLAVLTHGHAQTTSARAKACRPMIEKLITMGKNPSLTSRRLLIQRLGNHHAVDMLIKSTGPKYKDRKGGYTRIIKLGKRPGDNADLVIISLV